MRVLKRCRSETQTCLVCSKMASLWLSLVLYKHLHLNTGITLWHGYIPYALIYKFIWTMNIYDVKRWNGDRWRRVYLEESGRQWGGNECLQKHQYHQSETGIIHEMIKNNLQHTHHEYRNTIKHSSVCLTASLTVLLTVFLHHWPSYRPSFCITDCLTDHLIDCLTAYLTDSVLLTISLTYCPSVCLPHLQNKSVLLSVRQV